MSEDWGMCSVCNIIPAKIDIRGKKYCKICAYELFSPKKKISGDEKVNGK
jgi:hypothetical protein